MIINHQHFDLDGKIVLERLVYNTPMTTQRAMHNEACLLYNVKGDFELYSAVNKEDVTDSDCLIMKCGNYYTSAPKTDSNESSEVIAVHFYPELMRQVFKEGVPDFVDSRTENHHEISRVVVDTILDNYMDGLLLLFNNPNLVSDELLIHKVKEIVLILLNTNTKEASHIREILSDIFNPSQASFKEIINAHCYHSINIDQLAYLCNMSISTFKRKFSATYGTSPASYMREKKLNKAAQLLKTTQESITTICYDAGFSDASNFVKLFTSHFKTTPSKYRKQYLQG